MRIRTGLGPGDWTENVPAPAVRHYASGFDARPALGLADAIPLMRLDGRTGVPTNATLAQERRRKERGIVPKVEQPCSRPLRSGETCARTTGHTHQCRSRWAMDNMAVGRRAAIV